MVIDQHLSGNPVAGRQKSATWFAVMLGYGRGGGVFVQVDEHFVTNIDWSAASPNETEL
jgi:hypothetical protein